MQPRLNVRVETDARLFCVQQARFAWVFRSMEGDGEMPEDMADIFPDQAAEALVAQLLAVKSWLKTLPLSRRPLVKVSTFCMPLA